MMSIYELHTLWFELVAVAQAEFQFWLTISFAMILAGYYVFAELSGRFQSLLLWLYSLVSVVLIMRWGSAVNKLAELNMTITSLGGQPFTSAVDWIASILQTLAMVAGTAAIVVFLRLASRAVRASSVEG